MILYAEGFDDGLMRGTPLTNFADFPTISTAQAVTGTRSLGCVTTNFSRSSYYQIAWGSDLTTGFLYFAIRPNATTTTAVVSLLDNATTHLLLTRRSDKRFEVTRNGTALTGGLGSFVTQDDHWVHLSMKWLIHDSAGTFELRINGSITPDISVTGADTRNGANAVVNTALLGIINTTTIGVVYLDDIVVQDTTGSSPENDWLTEPGVVYLFPTASGDAADFTIGGTAPAASDWESLDEVPYDDGTTLVQSAVSGDQQLMEYGDLSSGGTIYAVIPGMRAQKAAAGSRSLRTLHKVAGTVVSGSSTALSTSWASYFPNAFHRDPAGNPWTAAVVSGAQFGFEISY